jgi:hypothetical protein
MENTKKKRILKNIDFSKDSSHLALVGPSVGGPANGADYALIMKSNFSQEFIEKASKVRVTMNIQDFLTKFYHIYYEDALVLAKVMGYDTEISDEEMPDDYEDYIEQKIASIEVMKSLAEAEDLDKQLFEMSEDKYLALLQDQELLEKAFKKVAREKRLLKKAEKSSTQSMLVENKVVEPSGSESLEKSMVDKTKTEPTVEVVEKSVLESVQKQLADTAKELSDAQEILKALRAEKQEAIRKSRLEKVETAVKNKELAEVIFKAVSLVEADEDFEAVVKALGDLTKAEEKSELFVERGASAESGKPVAGKVSPVAEVLKKKFAK